MYDVPRIYDKFFASTPEAVGIKARADLAELEAKSNKLQTAKTKLEVLI